MEFIGTILSYVFIGSIIAFFVVRSKNKKGKIKNYKKDKMIVLIAMISSFILTGVCYSLSQQAKQDAIQEAREEKQESKEEKKTNNQKNKDSTEKSSSSSSIKISSNSSSKGITSEQSNALAMAESYSDSQHLSKNDIYDQLVSPYGGKFNPSDAKFAVDNIAGVNWDQNALETAKKYSNDLHLSKNDIYDQLVSKYGGKFTSEQANYAINHLK